MRDSTRFLYTLLALALAAGPARAQNRWSYDHIHQAAPDPQQALTWHIEHLGVKPCDGEGNVVPRDQAQRGVFEGVMFMFMKSADARPSSGSVIDSLGFSFPDVEAKVKELQAAGARIVSPARDLPGLWKQAVVENPWGTKIEIVNDPDVLGIHHITLRVPDPEESLKWYPSTFGGERGKMKGRTDGVRYGRIWLLIERGQGVTPSEGHAIDHLGFRPTNLEAAAPQLRANGAKFTMEPKFSADNGHHTAYVVDPRGVRIELVQRPGRD